MNQQFSGADMDVVTSLLKLLRHAAPLRAVFLTPMTESTALDPWFSYLSYSDTLTRLPAGGLPPHSGWRQLETVLPPCCM